MQFWILKDNGQSTVVRVKSTENTCNAKLVEWQIKSNLCDICHALGFQKPSIHMCVSKGNKEPLETSSKEPLNLLSQINIPSWWNKTNEVISASCLTAEIISRSRLNLSEDDALTVLSLMSYNKYGAKCSNGPQLINLEHFANILWMEAYCSVKQNLFNS